MTELFFKKNIENTEQTKQLILTILAKQGLSERKFLLYSSLKVLAGIRNCSTFVADKAKKTQCLTC